MQQVEPVAEPADVAVGHFAQRPDKIAHLLGGPQYRGIGPLNQTGLQQPVAPVGPGANSLGRLVQPAADMSPGIPTGQPVTQPSIIDKSDKEKFAIKKELDPRGRSRARVRAYLEELSVARGIPG